MGENHNQMLELSTRPSTSVDYYNLLFKLLTMIYAVDNEIHGKLTRRVDISPTLVCVAPQGWIGSQNDRYAYKIRTNLNYHFLYMRYIRSVNRVTW